MAAGSGSYSTLGINATADTTNRLTLAADATLLNHDGDGHQLKINKASAADTASLLYQDAFSGRAELGLAGDDDFHFKVSADGTTWKEAILIDRSTGSVSFPHTSLGGGGREVLTANRTYYVRTDGSNSNTGLANNSGGAFLTMQKAFDVIKSTLDLAGYTVTIKVSATGAYAALALASWVGGGEVYLEGDTANMDNVTITGISLTGPTLGIFRVRYVKFVGTSGIAIDLQDSGILKFDAVNFGGTYSYHCVSRQPGCHIQAVGAVGYTISAGAAVNHIYCLQEGVFTVFGSKTVTLTGTPAFGVFIASTPGFVSTVGITWSGGATGARYSVTDNGKLLSSGVTLPGNADGSVDRGGVYS